MPEPEDLAPSGLHLPASDPAASAVEALRAMVVQEPVAASRELAAFLENPAGEVSGTSSPSRSDLVTVVRLPIRRVGRAAVAVGAAVALAALGGVAVAVASTGGGHDRGPAQVQQDDPSDTTTTTEATENETESTQTATAEPEESETSDTDETQTATHTANATASANHHDGVGSDDEHADVNGGGEVDHRAEHSPTAHPTGAGDDADEQGDDEQGDDEQGDGDAQAPASQPAGGSHRH